MNHIRRNLVVLFILFSVFVNAQINNFKSYSVDKGLPQGTVYSIMQDSRGYLWAGTDGGGVAKFDGHTFEVYDSKNGLSGNIVRAILEDHSGNIWFGTDMGLVLYDGHKFQLFDTIVPNVAIYCLMEDSRGILWGGTMGGGIFSCKETDGEYVFHTYSDFTRNTNQRLSTSFVMDITEDMYGRLWTACLYDGGSDIITIKDDTISSVEFKSYFQYFDYEDPILLTIESGPDNKIWMGSNNFGIFSITVDTSLEHEIIQSFDYEEGLRPGGIFSITFDHKGHLWATTTGSGICKFENNRFTHYTTDEGFPDNMALCITEDTENNMWFGTSSNGLCKLAGEHFSHFSTKNGLTGNNVFNIEQDQKDNYWIASLGDGITIANYDSINQLVFTPFVNDTIDFTGVTDIEIDKDGNIWILHSFCEFTIIDPEEKIYHHVIPDYEGDRANCILVDKKNNSWFGTSNGIVKMDQKGKMLRITEENEYDLTNNEVQTIIEDKNGAVWVGTLGGLAKFYNDSNIVYYDHEEGLFFKKIYCLAEDNKGNIWIGTFGGGVFMLDVNEQDRSKLITLKANDSLLSSNIIYSMVFANDSTLLVGTNRGMDKITLESNSEVKSVKNYNNTDGFIGNENNLNAMFRDKADNIWIGTIKGLTQYKPDLEPIFITPATTHVTQLKMLYSTNSKELDSFKKSKWHDIPSNLILPYDKNHISFSFTGISFTNPDKVSYKYKLEGVDDNWIDAGISTIANYSKLGEGMYSFKVISKNVDNINDTADNCTYFYIEPNISDESNIISFEELKNNEVFEFSHYQNSISIEFLPLDYSYLGKTVEYKLEGYDKDWIDAGNSRYAYYFNLPDNEEYIFKIKVDGNIITKTTINIKPPFWKTLWFITLSVFVLIIAIYILVRLRERKLIKDKEHLEGLVRQRTAEIEQQKEEIEAQRDEIQHQKDQITDQLEITSQQRDRIALQQKEIMDSIRYAKRIQTAILPAEKYLTEELPEHFILFKPRDIVSGDFYWSSVKEDKIILAAADCTGHGVPGAFMSMMGVAFLNQIITEKGTTDPAQILNIMRQDVITSLQQKGGEGEQKDGMDMALYCIDKSNNTLTFAGANNPLYFFRNNELQEIKGDKMPVAIHVRMDKFNNHIINLEKGDVFYVFSDGYADQFGGPKGKKFKYRQLKEILSENLESPMQKQKELLDAKIEEWMAYKDESGRNYEQIDDIVLIGLRI
jgi:ligand-binding sensor domain-containing protein/serine phosphatase RsbU (regulator of sigma subunit)